MTTGRLQRILPARCPHRLHGSEATRTLEATAKAALAPSDETLMQRAGAAAARLALAVAPHAHRIWIAAGPGNNGGDGIEAGRRLVAQGKRVHLTLAGDPARLPADAAAALTRAQAAGLVVEPAFPPVEWMTIGTLAIDALLGIGSRRAPAGVIAETIGHLNSLACDVIAVDIPTGIDPDSGRRLGDAAVRADHTLSLLTLKPGLFTAEGRDHAGSVWLDPLGAGADEQMPDAWLHAEEHGGRLPRGHGQHKGSFGDVFAVAGAHGMAGAALLCARAAHAAGAGKVHVVSLDATAALLDPLRPELMWQRVLDDVDDASLQRATIVAGCGGGGSIAALLPRLLAQAGRIVLDADALNALSRETRLLGELQRRSRQGKPSVLTPHPLEAARLLGRDAKAVQADRLGAARQLAADTGALIVLKGSGSVIAAPDRTPRINASGNASLATAGTGDVLAGWLAGTWSAAAGSHGAEDAWRCAFDSACHAVWWHGAAAERSGLAVLRAADLIEEMALVGHR